MTDQQLSDLAKKYKVFVGALRYRDSGGPQTAIDRGKTIEALLARDAALRANVSVIAAGITILSTIFNIAWTVVNAR